MKNLRRARTHYKKFQEPFIPSHKICPAAPLVVIQAKGGKYDITAAFDYVADLAGSRRVSGVRVGEVKDISIVYEKAPRVLVRMKISRLSGFQGSAASLSRPWHHRGKVHRDCPCMDRQYLAGDV